MLSTPILGIKGNCTQQNQVNTADDSTHRLDFEPKIDEQRMRRDSVHYRASGINFTQNFVLRKSS